MPASNLILSFALLLIFGQPLVAQEEVDSINPASVTDGPFVNYQNDSTLRVSYVCYGEHHQQTVAIDSVTAIPNCCYQPLHGALSVPAAPKTSTQYEWHDVSKVFAISDVHGEFEAMESLLTNAGVIDSLLNWSWGEGHLVIVGDLFDRGDLVTECLWLIYRLEQQAEKAGGKVHVILGNHELMVLRGDDRYLNEKYVQVTIPVSETAHQVLVGPNSVIGQWLRTKNCLILIDSMLFVHGGVSLELAHTSLSIPEINAAALRYLDLPRDNVKADLLASLLYGSYGPFWYRGLMTENRYPRATEAQVDSLLEYFGARGVVVGHSEQDSLYSHYGGRIFGIDIPVQNLGGLQGWLMQDEIFYRVMTTGELQKLGNLDRTPPATVDDLH